MSSDWKKYLAAWGGYVLLSSFAFPFIRITVMLFSIPLAMLGGRLYGYRGALSTVVLTIAYHYVMLYSYTGDPKAALMAFNPVGITTQTFFSCGAALLGILREKHYRLNSSLEQMVADRTRSLRRLTDYLIAADEIEDTGIIAGLVSEPHRQLQEMLVIGKQLQECLSTTSHPGLPKAEMITKLIGECDEHLHALEQRSPALRMGDDGFVESLHRYVDYLKNMAKVDARLVVDGDWKEIDRAVARHLCQIVHEAATNALQHAQASSINIRLEGNVPSYAVSIENNGKPMPKDFQEHMGLPLMRYRARRIGATLSIESGPGRNTVVRCIFPSDVDLREKAFRPVS